jgi:hypothetical protein
MAYRGNLTIAIAMPSRPCNRRTLAYNRIARLQVTYAEFQSRCACCNYFRTWPLDVPQKADYDATGRQVGLRADDVMCP